MKTHHYIKTIASILLSGVYALPGLATAKAITLYQEPKAGATAIGDADLSTGVIPIFTSKDGSWVKIGDPRNGNVGWVKSSELNTNGESSFIFSHRVSGDNKNSNSYQVFQFGAPAKLSPEQEKTMKQIEAAQAASRQVIQKAMQEMMDSWNKVMPTPIFMPVIVVPQNADKAPVTPATDKAPTSKKAQ